MTPLNPKPQTSHQDNTYEDPYSFPEYEGDIEAWESESLGEDVTVIDEAFLNGAEFEEDFSLVPDNYGSRPSDVTRSQLLELFKKTQTQVRAGEKDPALLDVLQEALEEEARGQDLKSGQIYDQVAKELGLTTDNPRASDSNEREEASEDRRRTRSRSNNPRPDQQDDSRAIYNSRSDYTLKAEFDGEIKTREITARGSVILKGSSLDDTMEILQFEKGPPQYWEIKIHKDGKMGAKNTETIIIHGGKDTRVLLDVLDASSVSGNRQALENVLIGANKQQAQAAREKRWPGEAIKRKISFDVDNADVARQYAILLEAAIKTGNGRDLEEKIRETTADHPGRANDAVRNLVSAIWAVAGTHTEKFNELMTEVPLDVRQAWFEALTAKSDELLNDSGDHYADAVWFNNQEAADKVRETLEPRRRSSRNSRSNRS